MDVALLDELFFVNTGYDEDWFKGEAPPHTLSSCYVGEATTTNQNKNKQKVQTN